MSEQQNEPEPRRYTDTEMRQWLLADMTPPPLPDRLFTEADLSDSVVDDLRGSGPVRPDEEPTT